MIDKPPGLPFLVFCSGGAAVLLIWASHPSWLGFETFLYGLPVGLVLIGYWALRMAWADYRGTAPSGAFNRSLIPWYIAGVVLLAFITDAPSWIRFTISEQSLAAYVRAVNENPERREPCHRVGLYYVCDGARHPDLLTEKEVPGSVRFAVGNLLLCSDTGLLWLPVGEPSESMDSDGESYRHIKGRWYSYSGDGNC
ncbi:hypothetical protein HII36_06505 [Nonomuraea sp. NN258]|uniref:hypothetical protein n=1 Tax=Nonomuraea antri TaxID=2730852 RepID=UPI001568261A|nr:hypothetical protein [Nonomuraea antri]NRQ31492.1 hypothetical protein [Nonomuraea antri]